jgi:hypothetical protein
MSRGGISKRGFADTNMWVVGVCVDVGVCVGGRKHLL